MDACTFEAEGRLLGITRRRTGQIIITEKIDDDVATIGLMDHELMSALLIFLGDGLDLTYTDLIQAIQYIVARKLTNQNITE